MDESWTDVEKNPQKPVLIDMKEVKRKKQTYKNGGHVKLKPAAVQANIADAINGAKTSILPSFPLILGALEPEKGARVPIMLSEGQLIEVVRHEFVRDEIIRYCKETLATMPQYLLLHQQANEAAKFWLATAHVVPADCIKMVRWADERGYTYRRLPWNLGAPEWTPTQRPAPTWESLLSRMSNVQAFIDWIGSLFFDESSLQNYVWIHGDGQDGKGCINRFLKRVFGDSFRSKQPKGRDDKFWTYGLLGARLVVFPDCDDSKFVRTGLFKSMTGGDPIDVEAKRGMNFTAELRAKYLIFSNERPELTSQTADLRRIIYCELGKATGIDPKFEEKLWNEGGDFLSTCVRQYEAKYPNHGPIKSEMSEIMDVVETLEEANLEVFDRLFVLDPSGTVVPGRLQIILRQEWPKSRHCQLEFLKWLERSRGIKKRTHRTPNGVPQKTYDGMRLKGENVSRCSQDVARLEN